MHKSFAVLIAFFLLTVVVLMESAFVLDPREQALVLEFGQPKRVIKTAGLHWKLPFMESLAVYDKRILGLDIPPEELISADKNRLVVDTHTRFKIVDPLKFYQTAGTEARAAQLLAAQISPDLRKVLGRISFSELLSSRRLEMMDQVQKEVSESASSLGVEIVDIRIRRADVPKQNSEAIYRRMNSERERFAKELRAKGRERAQRIRAGGDRESTIILAEAKRDANQLSAEGDKIAARIYAKAYQSDKNFYKFFRSLRAYETAFKSGALTTVVMDPRDTKFLSTWRKP